MKDICQLHDLLLRAGYPIPEGIGDLPIHGIGCDSRAIRPGWLFVAISGTAQDGACYVADAQRHGAAAVVMATGAEGAFPLPVIRVPEPRVALGRLAGAFYGMPSHRLRLAGITGTNGKTTTAYMIAHILDAAGLSAGVVGTIEYRIGQRTIPAARTTPDAATLHGLLASMLEAGCRSAVMEVSSHAIDQQRTEGIRFGVCAFTHLTQDHLDYHETMDAYFRAKARLFTEGECSRAVVGIDDPWGGHLVAMLPENMPVLTFGTAPEADVRADEAVYADGSWHVRLQAPSGTFALQVPMAGRYNVLNALCAVSCCTQLGVPMRDAVSALTTFPGVRGRLERVTDSHGRQVFVDYAHTDDALRNVLEALRETAGGRLIVVFGCGGDRDRAKRPLMGRVAAELADVAVITSDNPRSEPPQQILDEVAAGIPSGTVAVHEVDRRAAIVRAVALSKPGDTLLVAGKGHEAYQEFTDRTVPFDDVAVTKECLNALDNQ